MINNMSPSSLRLNACELLDLTPERVIALTGADMPRVQPTGSGDLGMLCTYGGPGSPERYEAELEAAEEAEAAANGSGFAADGTTGTAATTTPGPDSTEAGTEASTEATLRPEAVSTASSTSPTSSATTSSEPSAAEVDVVPDTFAAGVVKPRSGSGPALAEQPVMLGSRYSCSEVRGEKAKTIENAGPGVPEAPAPVDPDLESAYIDCIAAPTGGGVEVHTIFVADNDLWHITLIKPGTLRSAEADAEALAGLHKVAEHVLS